MEIIVDETGSEEHRKSSDHAMIDIESQYSPLATSISNELQRLYPLLEDNVCTVHRVPERLRQLDEKAYTPQIVSIGPIHHGREELKAMETYKRRYLQEFLKRTKGKVSLDDLVKVVKEKEEEVRSCYAETIEFNSDDFVKMILVDASFIIEVLLRRIVSTPPAWDRVYNNPRKIHDLKRDMYMLENQIPFFILSDLFRFANTTINSNREEKLSILKLTHEFSKRHWSYLAIDEILEEKKYSGVKHLLHFLSISILPDCNYRKEKRPKTLNVPSVTDLHQAGVRFKLASSKNLFGLKFSDGILEIPQISVRAPLEYVLKNLLAFEQCQSHENYLNDYVILINYLINSPKDVKLLVEEEILEDRLGDSEAASTLIHNFAKRTTLNLECFYYSSLVEDLNRYCKNPWHKWRATLKQVYFNTPWASISVIAAMILLILTIIQAVSSILQVS